MPVYNFATYADVREEWAIRADSFDHARKLIGNDASGDWLDIAFHLDAEAAPAIDEITPDHWGWRAAHRDYTEHSLKQNIAAIAGEFHTHRLYCPFYEMFGQMIDGFVGQYELCIAMAEALTEWEIAHGMCEAYENAGVTWIEVIDDFVGTVLETATETGDLPDPALTLPTLRALTRRESS